MIELWSLVADCSDARLQLFWPRDKNITIVEILKRMTANDKPPKCIKMMPGVTRETIIEGRLMIPDREELKIRI